MIVATYGDAFGVEGLALAAGLITPAAFSTPDYPDDGPQRYALRSAHHIIAYPGVGAAYSVNRYFSVGAVFLSGFAVLEQHQAIRPLPQLNNLRDYNESQDGDADLRIEASDPFIPTGILGVMSHPVDWLEVGAAVRFPAYIRAEGEAIYTPSEADLPDSTLERDRARLEQHFPWMVRVGARYIHRLFDVEVDFVWENWSSLEGFDVELDAAINDGLDPPSVIEMPDAHIPKRMRDTYSVRLGGDVEVWPEHIALRAGASWQSSAYPENNETINVDFPFAQQLGVGGGLTWHTCQYLDVNLGYLHVFQKDVRVTEGVVQQQGLPIEVYDEDGELRQQVIGNTVNNGKYEVSANIFGLSLTGHF